MQSFLGSLQNWSCILKYKKSHAFPSSHWQDHSDPVFDVWGYFLSLTGLIQSIGPDLQRSWKIPSLADRYLKDGFTCVFTISLFLALDNMTGQSDSQTVSQEAGAVSSLIKMHKQAPQSAPALVNHIVEAKWIRLLLLRQIFGTFCSKHTYLHIYWSNLLNGLCMFFFSPFDKRNPQRAS